MAYEYEESNKQIVFTVDNESSIGELNERIKELEEVYRKACAFDRIAEVHSDNDLYSDEYVLETIQEQIDELERADDGV